MMQSITFKKIENKGGLMGHTKRNIFIKRIGNKLLDVFFFFFFFWSFVSVG
jgi:hypothetical protein